MSDDSTVNRFVGGPPPLKKATSLNRERRISSPPERLPALTTEPEAVVAFNRPDYVEPARPDAPQSRTKPQRITFDIPVDLRLRARAMFKATAAAEKDPSFGAMLCTIIERECLRRENIYNAGAKYVGDETPLPPGRPLI